MNETLRQVIKDINTSKEVSKEMKDFVNQDYVVLLKLFNILKVNK